MDEATTTTAATGGGDNDFDAHVAAGSTGDAEQQEQAHPHDMGAIPIVIMEPVADAHDGGTSACVVSEWIQCMNEHGETYFCNVGTGETRWQLPTAINEAQGGDSAPYFYFNSGDSAKFSHATGADVFARYSSDSVESMEAAGASLGHADSAVRRRHHNSIHLVKQVMSGEIKRLDRNVQLQLEEARRRHTELEELRDEEVRLGGEHWIEMYDPTHDCFYYYGTFSGEMRWARPESYVMKAENDSVLRTIVRLQCAFRMKLARKRVFQMKVNRQQLLPVRESDEQAIKGDVIPHDASVSEQHPQEQLASATDAVGVWVEVYDPFHKVLYYYCSTTGESRWDPPLYFISASEDKDMAAAIAIQSLSRSFLARRAVKQRKLTLRKKRHEQAMEETRRIRELRHREFFLRDEDERASMCRREMIEEEMAQIQAGDRFWGIDAHDREVRRQRTEECMMQTAEMFWQRVNLTMKLRSEMHEAKCKEENAKRREAEVMVEAMARDAMQFEEDQQRQLHDNFWGIEGEELREDSARRAMAHEELLSRSFGRELHVYNLHVAWKREAETNAVRTKRDSMIFEKKYQCKYLHWFYHECTTVDDLLEYIWPTKQRFVSPLPKKKPKQTYESGASASPVALSPEQHHNYVLDDLVVQERLANGDLRYGRKSILTIHHYNSAQTLGRKGEFTKQQVPHTKSVFDATMAAHVPLNTSPRHPVPPRIQRSPEEELHLRMGTAMHYRRVKTPDPHLPARFNGIPFEPSEISLTRDILCSEHTKLTQLPSLNLTSAANPLHPCARPHDSSSKKRHLMRFGHYGLNQYAADHGNDDSERLRVQGNGNALQRCDVLQNFDSDELPVLQQLFKLMDYDGSGTVNKHEMQWALHRDDEIIALAHRSSLLRVLLKQQPNRIDELFDTSSQDRCRSLKGSGTQELSWGVFRALCEQLYVEFTDLGLLTKEIPVVNDQHQMVALPPAAVAPMNHVSDENNDDAFKEDEEEHRIRELFALIDRDGNDVLDLDELQQALHTTTQTKVRDLVHASKALQPLLHETLFLSAFRKFEPLDPRGISEEEFVGFCLETAAIAQLNGML
uniref:Uncharacterized protein n=1 Tax=Globisporangium ultimum (strain ATCC 200006 / CBS 805.95 / DAOM BR144) TaxID=431595 RepID=K3XCE5_GLOUD